MKTQYDLTDPDYTKKRMVAKLTNIQAQLWAMHDYIGAEKLGYAIDHIQAEISFLSSSNDYFYTEVI